MDIEELRFYCLAKKHTTESFPFDEGTLAFKVDGKLFALTNINKPEPTVNLKCEPNRAIEQRDQYPDLVYPGYHMSKKHWNTIDYESLPIQFIKDSIDHSYLQVIEKFSKKRLEELKLTQLLK